MPRLFALSLGLVLAPLLALAEPATVKRFEAPAHERPDATSPTVHTFIEDAALSVSEEAENGFRKVRLPDGNVGWIDEAALTFAASTAQTAVAADGTPKQALGTDGKAYPPHAPLRSKDEVLDASAKQATLYIKDLNHLAEMVKEDEVVAPMASALAHQTNVGFATMTGSIIAGVVTTAVGLLLPWSDCRPSVAGSQFCMPGVANYAVTGTGIGVTLVGSLVGLLVMPKGGEFLDVINTWNQRHPDEQISLSPYGGAAQR